VSLNGLQAQLVAGFDDLSLEAESYWNGSDGTGYFVSGPMTFLNSYNMEGNYWNGFSYSNITDNTTVGYTNQYSAITGSGAKGSANYAVSYLFGNSKITFDKTTSLYGLYVTNATYTAGTIKVGDEYSKKFGGETGDDPDWLKLTIKGWRNDETLKGSVDYYLADYRFSDNSADYIVSDWQWVDLSKLQEVDFLTFELSSTDNNDWGMNTPAFFCIDNITLNDYTDITFIAANGDEKLADVSIEFAGSTLTTDINGEVVFEQVSPSTQMAFTASKPGFVDYSDVINGFETTRVELSLTVGVEEQPNENAIMVYPTLANNMLYVKSKSALNSGVIYNVSGQVLQTIKSRGSFEMQVPVQALTPGIYFISVSTESGATEKQRFIKY
jgi:hypothetical protein